MRDKGGIRVRTFGIYADCEKMYLSESSEVKNIVKSVCLEKGSEKNQN